jgi:energy-coupling factor transporter ATP-binding protein EcfA2
MGAGARVVIPGIKFDYMLILEGPQGIGKSTLVKTLAGKWYTAISLTDTDKDTIDAMLGAWIIENEEMVCFSKQDIERVKAFISRSTDRVRLAYDRRSKDFPRQSIFIGTINPTGDSDYLKDSTGNRRFWPIVCAKVDIEWLKENRDQLFAEAVACFKAGEKLWIDSNDPKINELVLSEQEERKSRDPWTSKINEFVKGKRVVSSIEILESCLKIETPRITKNDQTRVGIVMSELKWKNKYNGKLKCREYWDSSKLILKTTFENAFATVEKTTFEKELSNGKKIFDWLVQALRLHPVSETRARVPGYPNNLDPYIGGISSAEFEAIIKILKRADLSWGAEIFNWLIERRYLERVTDTEACLCGSLSKVEKDLKDVYPDVCDKIFSFLEHYEDEED